MRNMMLLFAPTIFLVTGCQDKPPENVEFYSYLCSKKDNKCGEDVEIYNFKVRRSENKVLLSLFESDGKPISNMFLSDCDIWNRTNWVCKEFRMVEGALVRNVVDVITDKDYYMKYLPKR